MDFKKAFDTVIHAGIKFKLLVNNIRGQFYNIVKSIYEQNEVCVKVNNNITPSFMSSLGVRQGDVLSPNLFKIFINDLPQIFNSVTEDTPVLNDRNVNCLMYADDIVIMATSKSGLQERLNSLEGFCNEWCLQVNISKTKVLIFNKTGRHLKDNFHFDGNTLESVQTYRYLGVTFTPSGLFYQSKIDLFQKALKASFKLQKNLSSSNPSFKTMIHLFDHTIKPIVLYGSEIWGVFKTNSAACKRADNNPFNDLFLYDHADKLHFRFLKYILGVNRKSSNIAVLSETGRYPLYFSIISSMIKYAHRLESLSEGLLYDAFICNKELSAKNIQTWYSAVSYIIEKLDINMAQRLRNITDIVGKKLQKNFNDYWKKEQMQYRNSEDGKLDTYFKLKDCFKREEYLVLKEFKLRQNISKIRISSHSLKIETGRYGINRLDRSKRTCDLCNCQVVENEVHFILQCPVYSEIRKLYFQQVSKTCQNFSNLSAWEKFLWLFNNEDISVLKSLGNYIEKATTMRKEKLSEIRSV